MHRALLTGGQGSHFIDIDREAFSAFLKANLLHAGMSLLSRWPAAYHTLYLTAVGSDELGFRLHNTLYPAFQNLYSYEDYESFFLIHLAAKQFWREHGHNTLGYLMHPDAVKLYQHDENNKEHLIDVLLAYLTCQCNIDRTSKVLYLHRNTLYKKINKIQLIMGKKIEDSKDMFTIQFSCLIILYELYFRDKKIYEKD